MSSLYQKDGWFYYQWTTGLKRRQKAMKTKDSAVAKRLKALWDQKLELVRTGIAPMRVSIRGAVESWLELKRQTIKPGVVVRYTEMARAVLAFLDERKIDYFPKLTSGIISEFIEEMRAKKLANKTMDDHLFVLKTVIKGLVREGSLMTDPVKSWPTMRHVPKNPESCQFYSKEDIGKLKEFFRFREFGAVFLYALFTGSRREEIRHARVCDVHCDGVKIPEMMAVRNLKTEQNPEDCYRYVSIHPELLPIIQERIRERKPEDLLFPELQNHSRNWPQVQMLFACKKLGIIYRRFHGLRHTFLTYLLASGTDIRQAMDAVGHKRLETTQRYAHLARKKADVSKLDF